MDVWCAMQCDTYPCPSQDAPNLLSIHDIGST